MNMAGITRRIEALEEQRKAETPTRTTVRRIFENGKQIGGYTGPITDGMLVINRIIVSPVESSA
jgi:hypothetical protein